jgi:hypothetical protein
LTLPEVAQLLLERKQASGDAKLAAATVEAVDLPPVPIAAVDLPPVPIAETREV